MQTEPMDDLVASVRARAMTPQTLNDFARGLENPPPLSSPATSEMVAAVERELGFPLPVLLTRLLLEIGNGGFGPGYGIACARFVPPGVFARELVEAYRDYADCADWQWPPKMLPVVEWGCGIVSCVDCRDPALPVFLVDPQCHCLDDPNLTATVVDAAGQVVAEIGPRPGQAQPRPELIFVRQRDSFADFMRAWANGIDLWKECHPDVSA